MGIRLLSTWIMMILFFFSFSLEAQENKEPLHSCFNLEQERVVLLDRTDQQAGRDFFMSEFMHKKSWSGKQVFLRMPPTNIPYSFIINGFRFGSDPGSGIASEYNLTPFLNDRTNTLEVFPEPASGDTSLSSEQWATRSLLIRDAIHARDLVISSFPGMSDHETLVRIDLFLKSYLVREDEGRTIQIDLRGPDGKSVYQESRELTTPLSYGQETEMIFDINLQDPVQWLPGAPELYALKLTVDKTGEQKPELISKQFGITSFLFSDSLLVQNGDTIALRYPSDSLTTVLPGLPEQEITEIIGKLGINAIRMETPPPCHLEETFLRTGILVVSKTD